MELRTLHGHNLFDISSLLQKSIRRGEYQLAGYAANEMFQRYECYLWKRLLTCSAEDCFGIMTKEIIALMQASDKVNKGCKPDCKNPLFVAKAIVLLCSARKNRDADYFACNFMQDNTTIPPEKIEHIELDKCVMERIPEWVFDCHTLKGKMRGKTQIEMLIEEQESLENREVNLFDDGDWGQLVESKRAYGKMTDKEESIYSEFKKDKINYGFNEEENKD